MLATAAAALVLLASGPAAAGPSPALPDAGVLAPGRHLGGVRLGDTAAQVRARWGWRFSRCTVCRRSTWLYTYGAGPRGAAVSFDGGRVVAIFTLGVPTGWRTTRGIRLGDPADRVQRVYGRLAWRRCVGYGALSMRSGAAVSSIYTFGESVYGFALTKPGEPVCQ
jgi:hypothetical protein